VNNSFLDLSTEEWERSPICKGEVGHGYTCITSSHFANWIYRRWWDFGDCNFSLIQISMIQFHKEPFWSTSVYSTTLKTILSNKEVTRQNRGKASIIIFSILETRTQNNNSGKHIVRGFSNRLLYIVQFSCGTSYQSLVLTEREKERVKRWERWGNNFGL